MKILFNLKGMLWPMALLGILVNFSHASGQVRKEQSVPIPENINKIFQISCMPCHGNNGGRLPKSRLCFSRWAGYGKAKEAEKASLICLSVRKGKMPPKSRRDLYPGLIPTKEQVDLICNWAESFKSKKEGK